MKRGQLLVMSLLVVLGVTSVSAEPPEPLPAGRTSKTRIVPTLDSRIPFGKNVLWCATFQMVWDAAAAEWGRPLTLQPQCNLADSLNKSPFDRAWIDAESVVTLTGRADDEMISKIEPVPSGRAGGAGERLRELSKSSKNDAVVFYAKLTKQLAFERPFKKGDSPEMNEEGYPSFGFFPSASDIEEMVKQVRVHHYRSKDDFIVELLTKSHGDQLLLAKLPETPETPAHAAADIIRRLTPKAPTAAPDDILSVPNIHIDEEVGYSELEGRRVAGKDLVLLMAWQSIQFQLGESGAELRSEAMTGWSAEPKPEPRRMIVNPPFALVMKRKGAPQPYFVGWFVNDELLAAD